MKKLSVLAFCMLSSAAMTEIHVGMMAGVNLINGNIESLRAIDSIRLYKTNYNLKLFYAGVCAGYDWFYQSLMLGADASWLYNQNMWREVSQIPNGEAGILDGHETISIKSMPQYGIGIRIGYVNGKFIPYLRLGIEKVQFKVRLLTTNHNDPNDPTKTHQQVNSQYTVSVGAGFEYKTFDNFWLRFEGRYLHPRSHTMSYYSESYVHNAKLKVSPQHILLTTGIIYRF